jgi:hypothetical protein
MTSAAGILLAGLLVLGQCAEPDNSSWSWFSWLHRPHCPSCRDDYCAKQCPPPPPCVTSHALDDYCSKKLPRVTAVKCFGKDDYSLEPWRMCLPPCAPFWYTCGPEGACPDPVAPPHP